MKLFQIRKISTNQILFKQERESIDQVEVPTGWGLENDHEILEEEIPLPTYAELRRQEYRKRIDPFIVEAITDKEMGDPTTLNTLLDEKRAIKIQFPKPVVS